MENIESILNSVGHFSCYISGMKVSFRGVLSGTLNNIVLQCEMKLDSYRKIPDYSTLNIWGSVNEIPVSLLEVYLKSGTSTYKSKYISLTFSPSQIVIGQSFPSEPLVSQMSMTILALNYMFSSSPLQPVHDASKIELSIAPPAIMEADDNYGHLRIYQTFSEKWNWDETCYKILPVIEYQFNQPLNLMDALSKIATVRNLFTFFANYYLPLENISFASTKSKKEEYPTLNDCALYLNGNDDISTPHEPFLIMTNTFSEEFQTIWEKWLHLYEEAIYIPTLFYEIICNRSTRVNLFLNLSQSIEVYSKRYREKDAEKVAKIREKTRPSKTPPVHMNHRYEDILLLLNTSLEIDENKIPIIADTLADMRNFFTHYDDKKYMEPSIQEMLAACHVLEFVLLAIVYHDVGISSADISAARKRVQFQRFDEFVEILSNIQLKRNQS